MAAAGGEGKASFLELVRYADARDRCLMALGALGSFGDGMMQPLSMLVLGDIVNSYGSAGAAGSGFSSGAVDKVTNQYTQPRTVRVLRHVPGTGSSICNDGSHQSLMIRRALAVRAPVAVRRGCCGRLRVSR
jgi:hypothetical protein